MRPIRLVIQGLRSYRERQEIDFRQLTEHGLFGIFGPTGSGKSTLLDAITLALYGSATRASRSTQGTMNPLEARMEIVFEFDIGAGTRRRRYRVERAFKRGNSGFSVTSAGCRLLQIEAPDTDAPGLVMVAEGPREVDAAIARILGLEMQDFTRAVVLPQGQFAEFLQLTGADRNKMLERLFGLERYGKKLAEKVSQRLNEAAQRVAECEAALAEMGDASEEAVERARQAHAAALAALDRASKERREAEARLKEIEHIAELDALRKKAEAEAEALRNRAEAMVRLEERLARHRRAKELLPLVIRWEEARAAVAQAVERADGARSALAEAERRLEEAVQAERTAEARRAAEEPALVAEQARLKEAASLEAAWKEKAQALAAAEAHLAREREAFAKAEEACAKLEAEVEQLRRAMDEAERAFRAHHVSPETRAALDRARRALEAWRVASAAAAHQAGLLAEREASVQAAERAQQAAAAVRQALLAESASLEARKAAHEAGKPEATPERLGDLRAWLLRAEERVASLEEAESTLQKARDQQVATQKELNQAEARRQALAEAAAAARHTWDELRSERERRWAARETAVIADLARRLVEGEPCPVCGALHHPSPAIGAVEGVGAEAEGDVRPETLDAWTEADDARLAEAEARWQDADRALREAESRYEVVLARVEAAGGDAERAAAEVARRQAALAELWPTAPGTAGGEPPTTAEAWRPVIRRAEGEFAEGQRQWSAWDDEAKALSDEAANLSERLQRAAGDVLAADERLKAARAELDRQRVAAAQAEDEAARAADQLRQAAGEVGLGDGIAMEALGQAVEARLRRLEEDDRQAAQADARRSELAAALADLNARLQEAARERQDADGRVREAELRAAQLRTSADHDKARLDEMTGGKPLAEARLRVDAALDALRRALEDAVQARRQAEALRERAQTEAAQADAALAEARRSETRAEDEMARALADSAFATAGDVRDALLDEHEAASAEQALTAYHEAVRTITRQLADLARELGDRRLDEADLAAARARAAAAEAAQGEAQQQVGATKQQLLDLEARRDRYLAVRADLEQAQHVARRLKTLSEVLRGNAFVQFVGREQMADVARQASERLASLTHGRYRLVLTPNGDFVIRDDHLGGIERPVATLSGGETFVTSLSLALALSAHIQLSGEHPLEFFFLDEGFGTLDPDLLDVVMTSLERLRQERMAIGLISHVPELRERVPRRLMVEPAEPGGRGTRVRLERA